MDETNRLNRRSRARPYDLRRKVLLKNFLREQMTYIAPSRETSETSNDTSNTTFTQNSASSIDIGEDVHTTNGENHVHTEAPDFSENVATNVFEAAENVNMHSEDDNLNSASTSNCVPDVKLAKPRSKFSRFSSLIRLRSSTKKRRNKGITKAKHHYMPVKSPGKTKPLKSLFEQKLSSRFGQKGPNLERKKINEPHSSKDTPFFFSIFKSRRENKKTNKTESVNKLNLSLGNSSTDNAVSCSTSNQSVQTDLSWVINEINNIEQSNRLLREENRLLSQSLSHLMSDTDKGFDSQKRHSKMYSEFHSKNRNVFAKISTLDKQISPGDQISHADISSSQNSKSRILRSKSVQIHPSRRLIKLRHRTRSMNCHDIKNNSHSSLCLQPSLKSLGSHNSPMTALNINHTEHRIPRLRRSSYDVLRTLPVNSTGRTLQRRSSMPERTNCENLRSLLRRRSGSVRESNDRKQSIPFHALPAQAFY